MSDAKDGLWWQRGVMYNLYVRSFYDTNGDGVGDLAGVRAKLGYLQELGVEIILLTGILDSPWREFGFDVRDETALHPQMGTLAQFDSLLAEMHERGMKALVDFIPNHTSDEHAWFKDARSGRAAAHRDWYIWADPQPDGSPPNNWLSLFGGSAWEWDETSGQYYLHTFLKQQPDLNWRSPAVMAAMKDVLRFWLEHGVDGFRVDAAHHLIKDAQLRDNPPDPNPRRVNGRVIESETQMHLFDRENPRQHALIRELRKVLDEVSERTGLPRAWFAEVHPSGWTAWAQFYGPELDEFHFPFSDAFVNTPWDAQKVRVLVDSIEAALPESAWPNAHTGNFDEWRIATRVGDEQARVAAMLLLTLRGTPMLYYGEEIGMHNAEVNDAQRQDRMGLQIGLSRDPQRSPMQWSAEPNAGFSTRPGWLPAAQDYPQVNVAARRADERSIFHLYRALIACRNTSPALLRGDYRALTLTTHSAFAFLRQHGTERVIVALNFSEQWLTLHLPEFGRGQVQLSTHLDRRDAVRLASLDLRAHEGLVIRVDR